MSDFFVILVLKTVICKSKLLDFHPPAGGTKASNSNIIVQTLESMDRH